MTAAPTRAARLVPLEKARFVGAILVVTIHTSFLADAFSGGFLVPAGIARLAVPYFAIMTGYFTVARAAEQGVASLRRWTLAVLRIYGVLFVLYAPFFVLHLAESAREHPGSRLYVVAQFFRLILLKGFVLHLWYLPGIVYAAYLCVFAIRAARGVAVPLALAVLLYVGAAVLETWWWAFGGTGPRQIAHAQLIGELAFLVLLVPFVLMGCAIRRLGDRFSLRAAWWGLAVGSGALLAESTLVWNHGGAAGTLLSLLVVVPCGFRALLGASAAGGSAFPYGPVSNLVYYYHLFPLLVWETFVGRRLGDSVPVFAVVALATAAMAAVTLRWKWLAGLLT